MDINELNENNIKFNVKFVRRTQIHSLYYPTNAQRKIRRVN